MAIEVPSIPIKFHINFQALIRGLDLAMTSSKTEAGTPIAYNIII